MGMHLDTSETNRVAANVFDRWSDLLCFFRHLGNLGKLSRSAMEERISDAEMSTRFYFHHSYRMIRKKK